MREPIDHLKHLDDVVRDCAADKYGHLANIAVGLEGNFGGATVTPRSLSAHFLSRLVAVEGIVTKKMLFGQKLSKLSGTVRRHGNTKHVRIEITLICRENSRRELPSLRKLGNMH